MAVVFVLTYRKYPISLFFKNFYLFMIVTQREREREREKEREAET